MSFALPLGARLSVAGTLALLLGSALPAGASPESIAADGTLSFVDGSFLPEMAVGTPFNSTFTYDTDEANASEANTTPSTVPGHEFTSFYTFTGGAYGAFVHFPSLPSHLDVDFIGVVVNDDLALTAAETNGAVPDGTYDWIELLASNTVGICLLPGGVCAPDEFSPADGVEFTVALIADPSWFSDGSVVPDSLPVSYTSVFVGIEFDETGAEIGTVFATPTVTEAVAVPAVGPFGWSVLAAFFAFGGAMKLRPSARVS